MGHAIICQACGVEAQTKYVEFYQNIGLLVLRFHKKVRGNLCKRCIHKYFWQFTGVNATLGWWGMISLVCTPIFIINNTVRYLTCLGLTPPEPGATAPQLTPEATQKLQQYVAEIFKRLNEKEPMDSVAPSIARVAGVTPGQVALMVHAVAQQAMRQQQNQQRPQQPPQQTVTRM